MRKLVLTAIALIAITGVSFAKTKETFSESKVKFEKTGILNLVQGKVMTSEDDKQWWCYKISTSTSTNPMNGETTVITTYRCIDLDSFTN